MKNDSPINVLFLTGIEDPHHDFDAISAVFKHFLSEVNISITITKNLDDLLDDKLKPYDVIISNAMNFTLSKAHETALLEAIIGNPWGTTGDPKGFVGIHGASANFLNSRAYLNMLGGRFLIHPVTDDYMYKVENVDHPIMTGVDHFTLRSELYLMETYPPYDVLLYSDYQGFKRPIAWSKPYGLGRVCYLGLGHDVQEVSCTEFQRMVINAVKWTSQKQ
ncbi:hypothetical protein GCM10007916_12770 [Psychromonas marina]|uniref:ThuA-like domain-containing protein n=1 Tax=Psychromonas marina TaxID=88364 RepID=A0ABQ6DZ54_9GAMM|nr:ThuA domain-containing protein [Psychromonas marina]GLS90210.1 hypothetical protein GCM10007916_12770 [Psychromonas marina]